MVGLQVRMAVSHPMESWCLNHGGGVAVFLVGLDVEFVNVVRHLVVFEVHKQLEELQDFVMAPVLVLLQ